MALLEEGTLYTPAIKSTLKTGSDYLPAIADSITACVCSPLIAGQEEAGMTDFDQCVRRAPKFRPHAV